MKRLKSKVWKSYRFPIILLSSVLLGCLLGVFLKEDAAILKPFGDIFLNLMYTIVVPLVFFTISSSVANMVDMHRLGKILKHLFFIFFITSLLAALVMLVATIWIDPVGNANIVLDESAKFQTLAIKDQIVSALTVTDFSNLLSRSNMLPLIIFTCLFGVGVSLVGKKAEPLANGLSILSEVMMKIVKIIMYYAPIGLCAYFAALIGEFGPNLIGSYARSMALYYSLAILYFFLFYALYAYLAGGKDGVRTFFRSVLPIAVTSLATQSSLASLPTNLEETKHMKVPKDVREVVLPLGATMHMEGSAMAAILKIVFLFGIFHKPFAGIDTYLLALLIAVLSGVVMSGIPGGGLIGEMLIVSLYGFPAAAFPIIATIGFLEDPPATCLNVTGDSVAAMMVTRLVEGKKWLKRRKTLT